MFVLFLTRWMRKNLAITWECAESHILIDWVTRELDIIFNVKSDQFRAIWTFVGHTHIFSTHRNSESQHPCSIFYFVLISSPSTSLCSVIAKIIASLSAHDGWRHTETHILGFWVKVRVWITPMSIRFTDNILVLSTGLATRTRPRNRKANWNRLLAAQLRTLMSLSREYLYGGYTHFIICGRIDTLFSLS